MPYEYNQLLKLNLQKKADLDPVEADIDDLKQKKVTKFFAATDTLEGGEIAQYQGDNDAINGLINGYFYKSVAEAIIPKNIVFYRILNNITVNNVSIAAGDYYKIENLPTSVVNDLWLQRWINRYWLYNDRYNTNFVGYTVFDYDTKVFLTVTAQSGSVVTFDNGETADFTAYNGPNQNVIKTSTVDGIELIMSPAIYGVPNNLYITVEYNGKITPIVLEEDTEFQLLRTTEPVYINPHFEQVDTQSGLQNIENDADGDINILSNLNINGNLTVQGTQTTVHTQEIDSESDNINLRVNNPLGLENGEESGVKVLNYDGNNTNCFLGVDNQGWARVGDEGGTLQKLATIEDTPTDGAFVKYNNTTKELESTTDGSELVVNFASADVSGNIVSGDTLGVMLKKVSQYFYYAEISITPQSGDTHEDGFKALISNLTSLLPSLKKATSFRILFTFFNKYIVEGGAYSTDSNPNVDGHYYFCNFIAYRILGQANVIYQFGWSNTTWYFRTI